MNAIVFHLLSLSAKIALLGGIAWLQLYLLRRAPAWSRSRICAIALVAIVLVGAGEFFAPNWMLKGPLYAFTAASASGATSRAGASMTLSAWFEILWLTGVGVMLARAVAGRVALALVRRRATALEQVSGLEIRLAPVQTPILSGVLSPAILLPATASSWTGEQRCMVITHELTHYRQGDPWMNLLAQMVRAALWFHPVAWWLGSRLSREQELTCDEAVVASGHSADDYAAFLLAAARNLRSGEIFACAMAGSGARSLKERLTRLVDPLPRPALTRRIAASLASFALLAASMAGVSPVWSQSKNDRPVYRAGGGVTWPKVLTKVDPQYTDQARDNKIAGSVLLQCVVTSDGVADEIRIVRSLSSDLDQKAIEALAQWTFQPGTKDGKPVNVSATVEINFRLQ